MALEHGRGSKCKGFEVVVIVNAIQMRCNMSTWPFALLSFSKTMSVVVNPIEEEQEARYRHIRT